MFTCGQSLHIFFDIIEILTPLLAIINQLIYFDIPPTSNHSVTVEENVLLDGRNLFIFVLFKLTVKTCILDFGWKKIASI